MTPAPPPPVLPATSAPTTPSPGSQSPAATRARVAAVFSRPVAIAGCVVASVTLLAAAVGAIDPGLAPGGHPHATLHGTPTEALGILVQNGRLLIVPLLMVAGRWPAGRLTRHLGDLVVGLLLIVNPVTIGVALGGFGPALVPYLPHLPLEDAALATATGAWLSRRLPHPPATPVRSLASYALWTLLLTALGALVETFLVPHAS